MNHLLCLEVELKCLLVYLALQVDKLNFELLKSIQSRPLLHLYKSLRIKQSYRPQSLFPLYLQLRQPCLQVFFLVFCFRLLRRIAQLAYCFDCLFESLCVQSFENTSELVLIILVF